MDLTQEIILQHGQNSPFKGHLKNPTVSAEMENSLCGDSVRIDIKILRDKVVDICFDGEGCLISQASASLLIGKVKKIKDLQKIKKLNDKDIFNLLGIELTLSRVKCALLSLHTLRKTLK